MKTILFRPAVPKTHSKRDRMHARLARNLVSFCRWYKISARAPANKGCADMANSYAEQLAESLTDLEEFKDIEQGTNAT